MTMQCSIIEDYKNNNSNNTKNKLNWLIKIKIISYKSKKKKMLNEKKIIKFIPFVCVIKLL